VAHCPAQVGHSGVAVDHWTRYAKAGARDGVLSSVERLLEELRDEGFKAGIACAGESRLGDGGAQLGLRTIERQVSLRSTDITGEQHAGHLLRVRMQCTTSFIVSDRMLILPKVPRLTGDNVLFKTALRCHGPGPNGRRNRPRWILGARGNSWSRLRHAWQSP